MSKCGYRYCKLEVSGNKKYCCTWHGQQERQEIARWGEFPSSKRTDRYFKMLVGSERANKGTGQGRGSGSMVKGAMGDLYLMCTVERVAEFNLENVTKHFAGLPTYEPYVVVLGDGTRLTRNQAFERLYAK